MAKPVDSLPEFASDADYSVGPKVGQPTKSSDFGAALSAEGHVPGKDFPTTANEFNAWLNLSSLYGKWVEDGTFLKQADAHIVETNSSGTLNALTFNCGDVASSFATAAIIMNNFAGHALHVLGDAAQSETMRIDSTNISSGSPTSLIITNDAKNTPSPTHVVVVDTNPSGGDDSLGGISVDVNTDVTLAGSGTQPRELSAINAVNQDGIAGEFISNSLKTALFALDTRDGQPSIVAGYNDTGSVFGGNLYGNGIETRGGDGDSTNNFDGGAGIDAVGGDATNGSFDTEGGPGIYARGGASANEKGGPGVLCESVGANSKSLVVQQSGAGSSSQNLAEFNTDNNSSPGIVVNCQGFGAGISTVSEGGYGLHITMIPEIPGNTIAPAIRMEPQDPVSFAFAGDMWVDKAAGGGNEQLRFTSSTTKQAIARSNQENWVAGSQFEATAPQAVGGGSANWQTIADIPLETGLIPSTGTVTINMKAWGTIALTDPNVTGAQPQVRFVDVTANPSAAIHSKLIHIQGTGNRTGDGLIVFQYQLPSVGPRTFRLQYAMAAGTTANELADATDWLFELQSRPEA